MTKSKGAMKSKRKSPEYPYRLGDPVPVPLAIAAMFAVQVLDAHGLVEQSEVVHRYAHHIKAAIERGDTDETKLQNQ